jgi:nucleotide-binding universal stress UspA family protein
VSVIVTLDGSRGAQAALKPAADLARRLGTSLVLLHIHRPSARVANIFDDRERERAIARELDQWREELRRMAAGISDVPVTVDVRPLGDLFYLADAIVEAVKDHRAEYVVMSTRGESAIRHLVMGSVAMDVVAHSPVPVVLVRPEAETSR